MGGFNPKQIQELMSQAKRQAEALQQKMQEVVVDASVGGGSITLKMNGQKQVLQMTIDPEVVKSGDVEMLKDLVIAAFNEGTRKVDEAMQSSLGGMLGGMTTLLSAGDCSPCAPIPCSSHTVRSGVASNSTFSDSPIWWVRPNR